MRQHSAWVMLEGRKEEEEEGGDLFDSMVYMGTFLSDPCATMHSWASPHLYHPYLWTSMTPHDLLTCTLFWMALHVVLRTHTTLRRGTTRQQAAPACGHSLRARL